MKKKILVIDDDKLVLKSIRQALERSGYEVYCAATSDEAMQWMPQQQFNLVISDVRMPGHDGVAVIKRLRAYLESEGVAPMPFIFITGYASEEAPIDAIKLGAKDYLLKPFDIDELLKSVSQHIQ